MTSRCPLRLRRRRVATLACAGVACAAPQAVQAGAWSLEPSLATSAEYATNSLLRPVEPSSGSALVANVGLPLQWDDGARHFELTPRLRAARATGDSPIGAHAFYLSMAGDVPTERSDLSTSVRFGNDSSAIREPMAGTLIRTDVREDVVDANIARTDAVTERVQSRIEAAWESVDYLDRQTALASGLFSYRFGTLSGQISRRLTDRTRLELVTQASRYEVTTGTGRQYTYSVQGGLASTVTALWNYELRAGRSLTEDTASGLRSRGAVYLAHVARTGERATWSATFNKSIQPSGFGVLAESDDTTLSWRWAATARLSYFVAGRRSQASSSIVGLPIVERIYETASAGLSWQATETWTMSAQLGRQQVHSDATLFEAAQSGRGYEFLVTAERRFGRVRLT